MTVSQDVNAMYFKMSKHVQNHFQACFPIFYILLFNYMHKYGLNSTIHLVLDGWTAPIVASYLGLVVVWYENGWVHKAILDFIQQD